MTSTFWTSSFKENYLINVSCTCVLLSKASQEPERIEQKLKMLEPFLLEFSFYRKIVPSRTSWRQPPHGQTYNAGTSRRTSTPAHAIRLCVQLHLVAPWKIG